MAKPDKKRRKRKGTSDDDVGNLWGKAGQAAQKRRDTPKGDLWKVADRQSTDSNNNR